jgi:hypothetical protein
MTTFLAVVAIAVGVVYVISKKMLVEPASIMKPLPKAPEPVVKVEEVIPVVEKVKKTRKKTAPKVKKISAKKKAQ